MKSLYYLVIPVIFGAIIGISLSELDNDERILLSKRNLLENGSPMIGNPSATITILEWGDYQCTYCYRFHQSTLNTLLDEYMNSGKVNLVFKDFPLNGPDSILAAEASYCAGEQGKYWKYHDELYSNWGGERTGWVNIESLKKFAGSVNLEIDEFSSCLEDHKYKQKVLEIEKFGKEIGIDATPSFLIFNDEKIIKIRGNQPIDVFEKAINDLSG